MKIKLCRANTIEKEERDRVTYLGWGQKLSLDQYLSREKKLRAKSWNGHPIEMWLLKDEQGSILSSCETYPISGDQVLGIGSVFTEVQWRGRGFATRLLIDLGQYSFERGLCTEALILFSEVGERIYERAGFQALSSYEWIVRWEVPSKTKSLGREAFRVAQQTQVDRSFTRSIQRVLLADDLSFVCQSKSQSIQGLDESQGGSWSAQRRMEGLFPSIDQLKWHLLRESIYAEELGKSQPECIGARRGESFMIWMLDYKWDCLRILMSSFSDVHTGRELLRAACIHAETHGLSECRIWENDGREEEIFGDPLKGQVFRVKREDSIAMVHPLTRTAQNRSWQRIQRGIWI